MRKLVSSLSDLKERTEIISGCWIWVRGKQHGYGSVKFGSCMKRAHRVSWEMVNGPIPEGMCILHKCDTPACINPDHLSVGTQAENVKDRQSKGRGSKKLSAEQVSEILKSNETGVVLGPRYGVDKTTITRIRQGKRWTQMRAALL